MCGGVKGSEGWVDEDDKILALTLLMHDGTDEAASQSAATRKWEESRQRCRMAMAKSTKSRAAEGGEKWIHHLD